MNQDQRRDTAYHEAAHAVVGRALGLICGSATIAPSGDEAGHAILCDPWDALAKWEAMGRYRSERTAQIGYAIANMAGAEGPAELLGSTGPAGDEWDRRQAGACIDSLTAGDGEAFDRYACRLRRFAQQLVRRHSDAIERVAAELLKANVLNASQINAIIGGHVAERQSTMAAAVHPLMAVPLAEGQPLYR